ncbi:efflux transporter outer membrane subunit [Formicincola oecophyllae]|uniref:Efflux transporter outer membrane subunit n=1 Tax=Formicincola oecophyllae TaxID=2558361 RepID=A0A4Y6U6X9_9PROT|nr:efflux transporter outer membrane subunit [Formicincola oecophyllae]QDH13133.1 efflux transporter outer membrane subunit [Formicincola oecophyllae]
MSKVTASQSAAILAIAGLIGLAGCMVGPSYHPPKPIISARFGESPFKAGKMPPGWVKAAPDMAQFPKGDWWTIFRDPQLNQLEGMVATSNQSLKEYEAQYRKAAAMIDSVAAQLYPTLNGKFSFGRTMHGTGSTNSATGGSTGYYGAGGNHNPPPHNSWTTMPTASWTVDVWGTVRRQIQEQIRSTQADAALVANMKLSYELQLAEDYFSMRYQDSLIDLYGRNVKLYAENLHILENQMKAGVTDPASVLQAQYQYQSTQASYANAHVARAQYEHAIAVLVGKPPAWLHLPHDPLPNTLPPPPVALPSTLLERRPDIAQAERNMASMNAEIGYEIGAFYPQITLTANYGYAGNPLMSLFDIGMLTWSLGAGATETIFEGGSRAAAVRSAVADYDDAVANYRQTVLSALQDTEDQLSNLRYLGEQKEKVNDALTTANQAVRVAMNEYMAGTQIYTTVISAQQAALSYAQNALGVQNQRYQAELKLITDLGGGWSRKDLPSTGALLPDNPLVPAPILPNTNGVLNPDGKPAHIEP